MLCLLVRLGYLILYHLDKIKIIRTIFIYLFYLKSFCDKELQLILIIKFIKNLNLKRGFLDFLLLYFSHTK